MSLHCIGVAQGDEGHILTLPAAEKQGKLSSSYAQA